MTPRPPFTSPLGRNRTEGPAVTPNENFGAGVLMVLVMVIVVSFGQRMRVSRLGLHPEILMK